MNDKVLIDVRAVSKYYEDGKVVALDGVSIQVKKGEFLVIRGPSGSGKSTLLHLIGGLDSPSQGEIYFQEEKLKDVLKKSLFRINNIGFVFQIFYLWSTLNVMENVLLPLMEIRLNKREKLERAKLLIDEMGLSNKYFSSVRGLSVGERQRVAIARALVANPAIILADEPTGSLDSKNSENILQLFRKINKERGVTIVMVTHERMAEGLYDRYIEILDGKIQ
jgi:putative ABC transport system ATP-binding protein